MQSRGGNTSSINNQYMNIIIPKHIKRTSYPFKTKTNKNLWTHLMHLNQNFYLNLQKDVPNRLVLSGTLYHVRNKFNITWCFFCFFFYLFHVIIDKLGWSDYLTSKTNWVFMQHNAFLKRMFKIHLEITWCFRFWVNQRITGQSQQIKWYFIDEVSHWKN